MKSKNTIARRKFLQLSLAGASGVTLLSSYYPVVGNFKKKKDIIYRKLGRTNVELPIVSMGAMRGENKSLIEAGLKMGIVHFDTANVYQRGKNEEMLGEVLSRRKRKSYFIATKVVPEDSDRKTGIIGPGGTAEKFLAKFDESLGRLKLDQVDLLYVHAISSREAVLNTEMIKAVKMAKEQGKTRFVGVSTHRNEPEVLQAMIDSGVYDVALVAYNFKQDHRDEVKEMIKKAADAGIGIVAMKTMAGGFLDKEKTKPINTKAALKWVLQDENVCTSIPGFTSFSQLEESFSVMKDLSLSEEEKSDLETAQLHAGLYCNQCGVCVGQCKKSLPVNDLMRAYMYNYGYKEAMKAKELVSELDLAENPCDDCSDCTVNCPKKFDVASRVKQISRITQIPNDFIV